MTTEATQTATSTDAREASMSRVQTQDSVLANLAPQKAASEPAKVKADAEEGKNEGNQKAKKTPSERIQELAGKRREAEAKADAAERRAQELESQVLALHAGAAPMEAGDKPLRSKFASDDDYIEALTDWKARETLARREVEQAQARADAEQAELAEQWSKRQEKVMQKIPDYAEVLGKSELRIPNYIHEALLESEQGPQVGYYLALHAEEAKRILSLKPTMAIKRIRDLERDLADIDAEDDTPAKPEPVKETPKPQRSKAPEPIEPVKSAASASGADSSDYQEYKRRRQAQRRA